ncbi:cation transporter [Flavobacteriaceae bacterium]|nr:cation transporter [Flavobacteriaceae bacterium]|tara:strand:+ start:233 stop:955 length:723 start_codon:yes stop_codon:yes gene_type:complete
MNQTFLVSGMTCLSCKTNVENSINSHEHVKEVIVDFEKKELIVNSNKYLELKTFQNLLNSKYTISIKDHKENFKPKASLEYQEKSKIHQLKPLLLIILYITTASILLHYNNWSWDEFMLDFMGLFFIVFSFFKMLDLNGFAQSFKMYDPLAKRIPVYGWIYPFIETTLGLMFLIRYEINVALIITLIVLVVTTIGVTKTLLAKKSIQCACLGTALKLPMTEATFIENAIMIVMAIMMIAG